MGLTIKDKYAKLNMSKVPAGYKAEFELIKKESDNFSNQAVVEELTENFNLMYDMIAKKYPDAIEAKPVLKKTKADKVKVIKPKSPGQKLPNIDAIDVKILKKKLSEEDIEFIEDQLTNNENATDEEMVEHIMKETGITEAQAKKWVKLRDRYMQSTVGDFKAYNYSTRKKIKQDSRKAAKEIAKDIVKTRDGKEVNRKDDAKNVGKTFYDENGKAWKCKGYNAKLDECLLEDEDGKQISSCIKDMYVSNPVKKREKGDMIDECKDTLKEAGFTVKQHIHGTKKIKRSEPRPEKEIIKERVADSFTPIMKDIAGSEEKKEENKEIIELLESIKGLFTKVMNRISNLADDGKADALKKIEKLFKELVD